MPRPHNKLPPGKKLVGVNVWLNQDLIQRIKEDAVSNGVSASEYLRGLIKNSYKKKNKQLEEPFS